MCTAETSRSYYSKVRFILLRAPDCAASYYSRAASNQRNTVVRIFTIMLRLLTVHEYCAGAVLGGEQQINRTVT